MRRFLPYSRRMVAEASISLQYSISVSNKLVRSANQGPSSFCYEARERVYKTRAVLSGHSTSGTGSPPASTAVLHAVRLTPLLLFFGLRSGKSEISLRSSRLHRDLPDGRYFGFSQSLGQGKLIILSSSEIVISPNRASLPIVAGQPRISLLRVHNSVLLQIETRMSRSSGFCLQYIG